MINKTRDIIKTTYTSHDLKNDPVLRAALLDSIVKECSDKAARHYLLQANIGEKQIKKEIAEARTRKIQRAH